MSESPDKIPLVEDHHKRADLRLIRRAILNGWNVPEAARAEAVTAMWEISADRGEDGRTRMAAAKTMVAVDEMKARIIADEIKDERLDVGDATEVNKVEIVYVNKITDTD